MTDLVSQLVVALQSFVDEIVPNNPNDPLWEQARAALTAAKAGGWQDISTAPEGTMILCANMNAREARDWCFVAWIAGGKVCGHRMDKPTHWQPLPNPPKEQA